MTEWMLADAARAHGLRYAALRYFNVAGADPDGRSGECGNHAGHLLKTASEAAIGRRSHIEIYGADYDTPDGTCIRDWVHVSDLAAAHLTVLGCLMQGEGRLIVNCCYGHGFSVREVLRAVEAEIRHPRKIGAVLRRRGTGRVSAILLAAAFAAAPAYGGEAVKPQVGFDFDRQPRTPFELLPGFSVGSELRIDSDYESNFDLDDSVSDQFGTVQPRAEVYLSYEPFEWAQVYARVQIASEFGLTEDAEDDNSGTAVDLEELYLLMPELWEGVTVQVGRQDTEDPREWLFDQEFDALRVYWRENSFGAQAFVGGISAFPRRLNEGDRDDDTVNYFLGGYYAPNEESQIGVYGFFRDDLSDDNESPYFLGVQAEGRTDFNLGYWLEAAYVGGDDGANSVHGYGVDVGLFYIADLPMRPTITGGFAYGSGDDDLGDGEDGNFRQTGLQDNNSRFHGLTPFVVYGELFNPELSNMAIFTAGLGIRPTKKSSFDVVYHHYRQAVAVPMLRDVNIDADPNGVSKDLGDEVNFIVGIRDIKNVRIELVGAIFFPGDAFPGADNAYLGEIEIKYRF